jgi:Tfp pilus assembly protein PilO
VVVVGCVVGRAVVVVVVVVVVVLLVVVVVLVGMESRFGVDDADARMLEVTLLKAELNARALDACRLRLVEVRTDEEVSCNVLVVTSIRISQYTSIYQ